MIRESIADEEESMYMVCPSCDGRRTRTASPPGCLPETTACRTCDGVGFVSIGVTGARLDDLMVRSFVLDRLLRTLIRPRGIALGGGWRVGLESSPSSHSSFESARRWLFERIGVERPAREGGEDA